MQNDESTSDINLRFKETRKRQWTKQAGKSLQEMLRSPQHAMSLLRHPSPEVRHTAIEVLISHWNTRDNEFAKVCEDLTASDEDDAVRHMALIALGHCWRNSDNVRIGALLARVVENESAPVENRQAAYMSLVEVRKGGPAALEIGALALNGFSFNDFDWAFVKESLDTSRPSVPVHPWEPYVKCLSTEQAESYLFYDRGREAYERGEYEVAIEQLSEAIRLWPDDSSTYVTRSRAYIELGRLDDAIADLTHVTEQKPDLVEPLRERARAYRLQGNDHLASRDERIAMIIQNSTSRNAYGSRIEPTTGE